MHQILVTTRGIFLLKNLDLGALAWDKASEVAFAVLPLKIKGVRDRRAAPIAMK